MSARRKAGTMMLTAGRAAAHGGVGRTRTRRLGLDWALMRQLSTTERVVMDAASDSHLRGIPRAIVLTTVGTAAKFYTSFLSSTIVHNLETLTELIKSRPRGTPLLTVSNHMSTLDDPLMWGLPGISALDHKLIRWILTAEDICFTNPVFSYFFRLGKCIPVTRGGGICQPAMGEALERINEGEWLHTFPQGKVIQDLAPLQRLKWGIGSLIARATVPPIVLPLAHSGFEKAMPESYLFGRRPLVPLFFKKLTIVVGEPMHFDIPRLKQMALQAESVSRFHPPGFVSADREVREARANISSAELQIESLGLSAGVSSIFHANPRTQRQCPVSSDGPALDETATKWMYSHVTEHIRVALQQLVDKARDINNNR